MITELSGSLVVVRRFLELSRNRFRRPSSLAARNLGRFRRLVQTLKEKSPYYATIIRDRGIDPATSSVADFPVLTKSLLLDHFDDIVTDRRVTRAGVEEFVSRSKNPLDLYQNEFFVVHTSGSSGQIAPFVWHRRDWLRGLVHLSRAVPMGIHRKLGFVGAVDGHYAGVTMSQSSSCGPLWWTHRVKAFDIRKPVSRLVADLNDYKPSVLVAYATALRDLAAEKAAGRLKIAPRTLISGGEPLLAGEQELIESAFGAPVTNVYAASEHMIVGIGLPRRAGMVLQEDDLIIELFEDHTLITNLLNKTLPLIRYRMDDVIVPLSDRAPGWPAYRLARDIVGRREHAPTFLNENGELESIHPIVFVEFIVPGVKAFQIVVHDAKSFTFLAVIRQDRPRSEVIAAIGARLNDILATKLMRGVVYKVEAVDELPVDRSTGKFQLIRAASDGNQKAPVAAGPLDPSDQGRFV